MVQDPGDTPDISSGMTPTIAPCESQIMAALRGWLVAMLPPFLPVVQGQQNRMASPKAPFATLMLMERTPLASTGWSYGAASRTVMQPMQITARVQIFGPGAGDYAQMLATLWMDLQSADALRLAGDVIAPLEVLSLHQANVVNAEDQYEESWVIDLVGQVNISLTLSQDFTTSLHVSLLEIDATYPPKE